MTRPLPQPPNPDDLRRYPPASAECARMRGLMRDFVDGDLPPATYGAVEEHVHDCRDCGLALARAEHELLQVKRVFAAGDAEAEAAPTGFVGAVLGRLVESGEARLDDFEELDAEDLDAEDLDAGDLDAGELAGDTADEEFVGAADARDPVSRDSGSDSGRIAALLGRFVVSMPGILTAAVLVLATLVVVQNYRAATAIVTPERLPRLVITSAADTHTLFGETDVRLRSGDGVGNEHLVWVGADGQARADWHDATEQKQPAATLQFGGNSAVRLVDGKPVLVNGKLQVAARRAFGFAVANGSHLSLSEGTYLLSATSAAGERWDPKRGAPIDLEVRLEVLDGGSALIERDGATIGFVGASSVGVYSDGYATVERLPSASAPGPVRGEAGGAIATNQAGPGSFTGAVYERNGHVAGGSNVLASYRSDLQAHAHAATVGPSGLFTFVTGMAGQPALCDSDFAVLQVQPPAGRSDLGLLPPDAYRLDHSGAHARVRGSIILDAAPPFLGRVVMNGIGVRGARLVPVVVDELFGGVLPWAGGAVATDDTGHFSVRGLPAEMPVHQHIAVVVVHPDLEPAVVPVPDRGSAAAGLFDGVIEVRPLRYVRLESVSAANQRIEIWQELPGLPGSSAARLFTAQVNAFGSLPAVRVAHHGRLYFRRVDSSQGDLRPLVLSSPIGIPTYRPANGAPVPFHSVFAMSQVLPGTQLAFSHGYRHQHIAATASIQARREIYVTEALSGSVVGGAQVFALQPGGPQDRSRARFLGFTSMTGALKYDIQAHDLGIHVVTADGAGVTVGLGELLAADGWIRMPVAGRVLVNSSLRPPVGEQQFVSARFERIDPELGVRPAFHRFTGAGLPDAWAMGELPPALYRVTLRGQQFEVTVRPGQLTVLQ